jgi:hypothetical protein
MVKRGKPTGYFATLTLAYVHNLLSPLNYTISRKEKTTNSMRKKHTENGKTELSATDPYLSTP